MALSDVKHSTANACWEAIWPYIAAPGNIVLSTEEGKTNDINDIALLKSLIQNALVI